VVITSFRDIEEEATRIKASWKNLLRNVMSKDDEHYQRIRRMSQSDFFVELVTFVESTIRKRERDRKARLSNGRHGSGKV
jgi:hypothetical protein